MPHVFLNHATRRTAWVFSVAMLVGGYVLLVPSVSVLPSLNAYNEQRALQVGVLIASGAALLMSKEARREWLSVLSVRLVLWCKICVFLRASPNRNSRSAISVSIGAK
jgi:hypothetical protein